MKLELSYEPFSRYGSYLAVGWEDAGGNFKPPLGSGWYIRSHHARAVIRRELFLLRGLHGGEEVELEATATASEMVLRPRADAAGPCVRIVFDDRGNLRIRGEGMGLRLEAPTGEGVVAYSEGPGLATVNARLATRRYQFEAIAGEVRLETKWGGVSAGETRVDLTPDESGVFECAMDEFWSTWVRPESRASFDDAGASALADFERFRDGLGERPADPALAEAWDRAAYVCWSTVVRPDGQLGRPTMFMSKNWMDQVWSWDNCFNAQALARGHQALAWDQWLVVFDHQDEHGAIPDGLNEVFKHYNFCKPPVHGWTLRELIRRSSVRPPREDLVRAWRHLARHARWFLDHRRRPGDALPYYLHGNDSGWDNATMFDDGVPLIAPDLAALLVDQTDVLADLGAELEISESDSDGGPVFWRQQSDALLAGLLDLWDGERFVPQRIANTGAGDSELAPVATQSLIPCIPIFLGDRLPRDVRDTVVESIRALVTEHGVATEPPESPHYEPDGYWRGPVWGPSTYLVVEGLRACGEDELASTIAERFCRTCAQNGFAENFDALTGEGLRDRAYSWTASVFLLLQGA
jgi:hypothetical protein